MDVDEASGSCSEVIQEVSDAVIADESFLETVLVGVLSKGHVLLEDVPGTGKTLAARCFAQSMGLSFSRIQFTPDMLPSDITGSHVYNEGKNEFEFNHGPVFANMVLADEINRSPPKTQAALLEAMEEKQVTVDGDEHTLPEPFFVVATQNPIDLEGTFQLPEAQLDRFIIKTDMGYPDRDGEMELLSRRSQRTTPSPSAEQVLEQEKILQMQDVPETVSMTPEVQGYIVDVCRETRNDSRVEIGVSPRGVQRLYEAVRARSVIYGRDYITPDDVKALAEPVLSHRLVLKTSARVNSVSKNEVVRDILDEVPTPTQTTSGSRSK